jgi:hypothetical protein
LNPKKFGSLAKLWKLPLPEFIEEIYFRLFKKRVTDNVRSIEKIVKDKARKKAESKVLKEMASFNEETKIA